MVLYLLVLDVLLDSIFSKESVNLLLEDAIMTIKEDVLVKILLRLVHRTIVK
jgi:hypothetical protein